VTHGIYRVTRNPMYLGLSLMMLGVAAGQGTWPFYLATVVFFKRPSAPVRMVATTVR
jgi:protein-S-isoprenylcysteine O-methyltransferase Ste14